VTLVLRVPKETQELKVTWELKVLMVTQVCRVLPEIPVPLAHKATKVYKEFRATLE
jgi:hypothetical protein